ncbi:MAG: 2-polyprenyl-3-methyl-5-hydroxy-6-metoxy-1, 4-benzoquinol methylase [uncultured bacterium]|nr:MAG: 2-polyprenyl-3-methyl-5-hydroxy-6-metoxy-1, 4-benzoquinol methylase [uncultured bacterium]
MNITAIENHIICINCGGDLKITKHKDDYGLIECVRCKSRFPIIKGIPRLLRGDLLKNCYSFYYDYVSNINLLNNYFQKIADKKEKSKIERQKSKTQQQFGYEWHIWKKLPDFAENHFLEIVGKDSEFFQGKTGWDPAVGNGRDLLNASKAVGKGGLMIGSDLSFAVDIAAKRCQKQNNVIIIQADLYTEFLKDKSLDFAYLIGVIQHLPYPKKAVEIVYRKIKKGGFYAGTVYTKPNSFLMSLLVNFIMFLRIFTLHLPLPVVLIISKLLALPSYLFFKLPRNILKNSSYIRDMEDSYPTHKTQKREPDFMLLTHNWFDHLTPPIIGFYSDKEILAMIKPLKNFGYKLRYGGIFSGTIKS